jgi:hypothetical protein
MESEGDDEKEAETKDLDNQPDFHNIEAILLFAYAVTRGLHSAKNLNKESHAIGCDEDRRFVTRVSDKDSTIRLSGLTHPPGCNPKSSDIFKPHRCDMENDPAL